ncbi:MAG: hypothetical protein ACK40V_01300, partial [Anaerolineales bacterium]
IVPSSTVISSKKDNAFVQTDKVGVNEITCRVGVSVNANVVEVGAIVADGCVGGMDVGGRKGVGSG